MENKKRLIDADEAIEKINCLCVDGNENWIGTDNQSFVDHADVIDILSDIPTVDAVEVVRCKDCRDCEMCYPEKQLDKEATQAWLCKRYKMWRKPDDFCSYGERREGE